MKIKLTINHLIIISYLLLFYRLYSLKFAYILVIPGYYLLTLFTKYDFNKKVLFSIPLSLILYVYPYFIITRIGLSLSIYLYLIIPALMIIHLIIKGINFELKLKVSTTTIMLLLSLIVLSIIYYPYFNRNAIPLTEAVNEFRAVNAVRESIISKGVVLHWNEDLFGGTQYFYIGPPLTTLTTAFLSVIPTEQLYQTFNLTYVMMITYLLFTSYMLYRKLRVSKGASIIMSTLVISVPLVVGEITYSGNLTSPYMFSLYPLALYGFTDLFNKVGKKDLIINAITLSSFFLTYHFMFIYYLYPALLTTLLFIKSKRVFNNSLIYYGISGLIILSWVVHSLFLSSYVEIMGYEGDWNKPLSSFSEFLHYIANNGDGIIGERTVTMTPLFFYGGMISTLLLYKSDKKLFLFFVLLFLLIISELSPIHKLIPLRAKYYNAYRFWFAMIPIMALGIARLSDLTKKWFTPIIILLLFSGMIIQSATNVDEWLRERAVISEESFKPLFDLISNREGRSTVFGIFGPGIQPAIPYWTGKPIYAGYNYERYGTKEYYNKLVIPVTKASMDFINNDANPVRIYNSFMKSMTNTIIYYTCSDKGFNALNKTLQYNNYQLIAKGDCVVILGLNSSFAESVYLSNATNELKNESMNIINGYKLVFPLIDEKGINYTNQVTTLNISEYKTNSTPLVYKKVNDYYLINAPKGYVLVKEAYFPTWHAYNNDELRIIESFNGLIIIDNTRDGVIKLINKPHPVEYLSLIIFIISLVLIYSLSK